MKKIIFVLCILCLLSGCNNNGTDNNSGNTESSISDSYADTVALKKTGSDFPFSETKKAVQKASSNLTEEEINDLSTQKCGYGQGLRLDENNRPFCALDFNAQFGKYDSFAINENCGKEICLTFDQGYENGYTASILDTLKEKGVKATFFILEDYAKRNPELVKRMVDEGHTLGNHSMHHYSMPTLDINTSKKEINDLHDYILKNYGYDMTLFRPPMGEFSEKSLAITQFCGYKTVMWSYAYCDWDPDKQMDPAQALEKVTNAAHDGCIYLLHSVSKTNAEILPDLIDNLSSEGYSFSVPQ